MNSIQTEKLLWCQLRYHHICAKTSNNQSFSDIVLVKSGDNFWVKVVTAEKWGSCPQVTNLISETKLWPFSSTLETKAALENVLISRDIREEQHITVVLCLKSNDLSLAVYSFSSEQPSIKFTSERPL